ncbi:MAG TPA: 3'(2'),5'-bisphosphate nucleotidase CysQ [Amaricoccus sp.]|nr:3'(2'),5'-bisphosphate nucleotidase CysQ [Amaricoccus sp.]
MPEADLGLLETAAREAGALALARMGDPGPVREKAGGLGPVSAVDLAVDRLLAGRLRAARPDYGWLSEESEDGLVEQAERALARRVFIVDPIDGTRAFLAGEKGWALSLAVVEDGRPVAALVHLPALGRTYAAAVGEGAQLDGAPIAVTDRREIDGARVLATAGQLAAGHWRGRPPAVERHFRTSLAFRLCLVAGGEADAALSFRDTWEWDAAAGDLIAREAGAQVTEKSGAVPAYNRARPLLAGIVAAGPALHASILSRI